MSDQLAETEHDDEPADEADQSRLQALQAENDRLRREYARAKQTTYRRTAGLLAAVGVIACLIGLVLPDVRDVLFVVGAIGVFGGILTAYLTPERVLTIDVSESVHAALASNGASIRQELGLQQTAIYVPDGDAVRLFVPQHREFDLPDDFTGVFLAEDAATRGVAFTPAGLGLIREFERAQTAPTPNSLASAVEHVGDAAVEQFEIADTVTVDADVDDERVVVSVEGSAFGPLTEFDHPVVSVLGCGAALALDKPLRIEWVDDATVALEPVSIDES